MPRVIHFEIPVDDPERAKSFYASVFGWELSSWGETPYWLASTGGGDEPGIDGALIGRGDIHASPVVVVAVADLDAAMTRVAEAGGELLQGRSAVPGMGWSAYLRDPEGNVLGLWQGDESAT